MANKGGYMKGAILLIIMLFLLIILYVPKEAVAGCIGPVIMGRCQGQEVPWDTHPMPEYREQRPAPPGFYWDKRGTETQGRHPEWINPFTGRDPHDSNWFKQEGED